jgi:hypothetical protein
VSDGPVDLLFKGAQQALFLFWDKVTNFSLIAKISLFIYLIFFEEIFAVPLKHG